MELLIIIPQIFAYLLTVFLLASGIYFLFFAVAARFYHEDEEAISEEGVRKKKVVLLIPAYKEDYVIIETAAKAQKHFSRLANCEVVVIGDQLRPFNEKVLDYFKVKVIPVFFRVSSKSKSIRYALSRLDNDYDYVLVLDADNAMAPGFVDHIVSKLDKGHKVVQGHRVAKNKNNQMAILDAISEAVNNAIFRIGHRSVGLTASLIGSGFGAEYKYFKSLINKCTSIGGFDKELELMIIKDGHSIAYARNAVVLDEKIQDSNDFVNQRRRWLSAQMVYLQAGVKQLFTGRISANYLDKIIQFVLPPRVLAMGTSLLISLLAAGSLYFSNEFSGLFWLSLLVFLINGLSVAIATPGEFYSIKTLRALWALPKGYFLTMLALLKVKNANKQFLHTTHKFSETA
ncbi:MAG: glycosyltransferase family 2 protein [Carboxylicivirga sp.]|jgi:cellulose synthase/poly-beta-1,6-N-acetylglucosamine synthase-like glycosyltransferase|nr:glycosyltransferase family 2 protein [Carboxylicivirga sp.]